MKLLLILNKESVNSPSQHFVHSHRTLRKYDLSRRVSSVSIKAERIETDITKYSQGFTYHTPVLARRHRSYSLSKTEFPASLFEEEMDFFLKSDTYAGLTPSDSILLRHRTGTFHRFGLVPAVGDLLPSSAFYIYRMSQGFLLKSVFREACFDSLLWNFPLRVILEDLKARLPVLVESVKSSKGYLDDWKQKEHLRKSLASFLCGFLSMVCRP